MKQEKPRATSISSSGPSLLSKWRSGRTNPLDKAAKYSKNLRVFCRVKHNEKSSFLLNDGFCLGSLVEGFLRPLRHFGDEVEKTYLVTISKGSMVVRDLGGSYPFVSVYFA